MAGRIAIAAALAACACGNPEPDASRPPERPDAGGPTELPSPPSTSDIELELLDPGSEPRRALRYRPAAGSSFRIAYTMDVDYGLEIDGHRLYGERASSRIDVELATLSVEKDATRFRIRFRIQRHDYAPIAGQDHSPVEGEGTLVVSSRGRVVSSEIPMLAEEPALQEQIALSDLFFILPEEAVGEGARWKEVRHLVRNGMSMKEIETYQLTRLAAGGGATRSTLDQSAPVQVLTGLAFEANPLSVFELISLSSEGTGEGHFSLDHPVPERTRTDFSFVSDIRFRTPEHERASRMTMTAAAEVQRSPMERRR